MTLKSLHMFTGCVIFFQKHCVNFVFIITIWGLLDNIGVDASNTILDFGKETVWGPQTCVLDMKNLLIWSLWIQLFSLYERKDKRGNTCTPKPRNLPLIAEIILHNRLYRYWKWMKRIQTDHVHIYINTDKTYT